MTLRSMPACPCCALNALELWPAQVEDAHTRDLFEDAAPGRWVVVRGGDVLTMTSAGTLRAHDVLAVDGVIADVRPTAGAVPEGALVVDARGKYVIPGLAEMHTHPLLAHSAEIFARLMDPDVQADDLVLPYDLQMFLQLASGVTRIEIMAGTVEELALREAVRTGRVRGPAMRVASPVIDGHPPMQSRRISWIVNDADGGRHAARQVLERGYDFAKPYSRLGREHAFEFFCYDPAERKHDAELLRRRAEFAARRGVTVQATLCAAHTFEYQCGHVAHDARVQALLDPVLAFLMRDDSPFLEAWRADPELVEAGRDMVALSTRTARALVEAGVRVLPGTDLPGCNVTSGYSIHEELRLLVDEVGLAPLAALRAATVAAAEYHGEAGRAGALAAGQRSDLVVLDRDPSADIGATREIDTVVIGRSVLRQEARARGLARARARYAAMPLP